MKTYSAKYWNKAENDNTVICELCPHRCKIVDGKEGICGARKNVDGELFTKTYGEVVSIAIDPIEKKPLYHFFPGELILSTGPRGCNLRCGFCQNWSISQMDGYTYHISPEKLVETALRENSIGLAFTYTEPTIAFEFIMDCALLARKKGLVNVLVTNGFINEQPLVELLQVIDALNIDLKSMSQEFYKKYCGGDLEPVSKTIEISNDAGALVEVTNLIIPGYNDSRELFSRLTDFIYSLNPLIPLHFSAYYPCHKFTAPPTPVSTIKVAVDIASEKLEYVYAGNIRANWGCDTKCPKCANILVSRNGFRSAIEGITRDGLCTKCGRKVDIIGPWNR